MQNHLEIPSKNQFLITYSAFQINHPPLGSGGGMAAICHTAARGGWAFECPFVRLGVGLARLCHATSRGVGGFGWSSWSGGGVGKTCQGGVGAVACGRGGEGDPIVTISISNAHPQSSYPFPNLIPDAHPNSQSLMPIPNPHPEFLRLAGLGGHGKFDGLLLSHGGVGERLSYGPAGGLQIRTTSICTGGGDGSRLSCA